MNLSEIKQLIGASGGKLILSDGNLKDSFIVMKISDYLFEKDNNCDCFRDDGYSNEIDFEEESEEESLFSSEDLTDAELLDKINADIDELKRRKQEKELTNIIEGDLLDSQKEEELNYEKI